MSTKPTPAQTAMMREAIDHIENLLEDFISMGDTHGTNSGLIGRAAIDTVTDLLGLVKGDTALEDIDVFRIPSLIDGARSVPDAKPAGIAILNVAHGIADALATLLMDMPNPNPELFDALQQALAAGQPPATQAEQGRALFRDEVRMQCCLLAIQELDAMLDHVQRCIDDEASTELPRRTGAIMARAKALSSAIQSGIGDEVMTTEEIAAIVQLEAA